MPAEAIGFVDVNVAGFDPLVHRHAPTSPSVGLGMLAAARRLGFRTVAVSADPEFYGPRIGAMVDAWERCDVRDPAAVAGALRPHGVAATLTSIDQFLGVAAVAARLLGVPGPDPECAALARDKAKVRAALDAAGVPNPRWAVVPASSPAPSPIGYPCIAKPVDGSASWDVVLVRDDGQLAAAGRRHLSRTTYGRGVEPRHALLLEEVLAGPLFSAEGMVVDGEVEVWGYSDRELAPEPFFYETSSTFSASRPHPEADAFVERVLAASGYDRGPFHLELALTPDGPRLVELNARLIGGGAHQCLDHASGADVVEHVLRRLLGEASAVGATAASTLKDVYASRGGRLRAVRGVEAALGVPGVERVELREAAGQPVREPSSNSDALGYVLTAGPSAEASRAAAARAAAHIELDVGA